MYECMYIRMSICVSIYKCVNLMGQVMTNAFDRLVVNRDQSSENTRYSYSSTFFSLNCKHSSVFVLFARKCVYCLKKFFFSPFKVMIRASVSQNKCIFPLPLGTECSHIIALNF